MKKAIPIFTLILLLAGSCQNSEKEKSMKNPLLSEFSTPFKVPPFEEIENDHFLPAAIEAMKIHSNEIEKIVNNQEAPDFENTIIALERSGQLLNQVQSVFYNLNSSLTGPEMQEIAKEMAPKISAHSDQINLNQPLFERIKTVYENVNKENLSQEDRMLLEETYKDFVRGGANLNENDKERLRNINEKLALLSLQFGQNVLGETNSFRLVIENEDDLAGLPANVISTASETAKEKDLEGKWVFTVQKPSMIPFLTYADNRDLREKLFTAYINLGNNDNEFDNKAIIREMVQLRAEKSNLLGYDTHAAYILDENMAKTSENVLTFLEKVWTPALEMAKKEAGQLQAMISSEGHGFDVQPWDWWYYAEKVRKDNYDLDEETMSRYFVLDNVREGVFQVATNLFGLTFEELSDVPKYHEDVKVFEVKDNDGMHLGILYMDFHPRDSKRAGAWMSEYRGQKVIDGKEIRPVVTTNFNFTEPTVSSPALLTMDEVLTTFHEFGHALHGLLSQCKYGSLSGTSVPRDFVELPSQVMENWAMEPEVLKSYARHYQTGEIIPDDLIAKIEASRYFNQGFATVEYLAASFLDMDYHTLAPENAEIDVTEFEKKSLNEIGLIDEIVVRYRSTYFNHIFSGGYSSGYYSYIWAEQLDADAFQAFKETGNLFNPEVAEAFRSNVLEKGGTADPMKLYIAFRGSEPGIEPLLKKRGLLEAEE